MIEKVSYKEGDIEIDISGAAELNKRADVDRRVDLEPDEKTIGDVSIREFEGNKAGLGGLMERGGKEEEKLKTDLKRTGWNEARKATDVKHVCPVCGTRYWARPNKNYCTTRCKEVQKKRRYRKRIRDIKTFKPNRGKAGEVYFMYDNKGKNGITFVPAFHADSRERAKKYIEDTYPEDKVDDYFEQVKEVIRK